MSTAVRVDVTVNGERYSRDVEPRLYRLPFTVTSIPTTVVTKREV